MNSSENRHKLRDLERDIEKQLSDNAGEMAEIFIAIRDNADKLCIDAKGDGKLEKHIRLQCAILSSDASLTATELQRNYRCRATMEMLCDRVEGYEKQLTRIREALAS